MCFTKMLKHYLNYKNMKKIIIGNWKMNPQTSREAVRLASKVGRGIKNIKNVEIVLAPPFIHLDAVRSTLYAIRSNIKIGAQDAFWERGGAYTGEISSSQLKAYGVRLVIVGHSERRALGETDAMINKKLKAVLGAGMRAILCVGEQEKAKNEAFPKIIRDELSFDLAGIKKTFFKNLIIAYEPIWAIGGSGHGRADTPKNVYEISILIRRELYRIIGRRVAEQIPVLYGGSVDEKNAKIFIRESAVDGLLIGGASLNYKKFVKIVKEVSGL